MLTETLEEENIYAIFFYYLPLIACYALSFDIPYKLADSHKFTEVVPTVLSLIFGFVTIVSIISGIATIIDICAQDMSKLYIIPVVFFIAPIYWIVSIVPAIIVSLVTWIAIKIKFA